jgi:uncharacterized MAPEG superfamily protein
MTPELTYLAFTALFTALMWIPYVLNRLAVLGVAGTVGYPENPPPLYAWAQRARAAHGNAVENLAVFASLVLVAHAAGVHNAVTVMACVVFFWARVLHFLAYSFAVPWLRTLAFAVGFVCQMAIALQVLI